MNKTALNDLLQRVRKSEEKQLAITKHNLLGIADNIVRSLYGEEQVTLHLTGKTIVVADESFTPPKQPDQTFHCLRIIASPGEGTDIERLSIRDTLDILDQLKSQLETKIEEN